MPLTDTQKYLIAITAAFLSFAAIIALSPTIPEIQPPQALPSATSSNDEIVTTLFNPPVNQAPRPYNPYHFSDHILAANVLKMADEFEPVSDVYYNYFSPARNQYDITVGGLFKDDLYCDVVLEAIARDPSEIFHTYNIFTDYPDNHYFRDRIVPLLGYDMMPEITLAMGSKNWQTAEYLLAPKINNYFTYYYFEPFMHIGKEIACTFQEYNHIPGHAAFYRKDLTAVYLNNYNVRMIETDCFDYKSFYPSTWVLNDPNQCTDFFRNHILSAASSGTMKFITKTSYDMHDGYGINLLDENEIKKINEIYTNGDNCGIHHTDSIIVQRLITNPLLVNNKKFELRAHMLIASTNPLIVYYYDGYLRISLHDYDEKSTDKNSFIPNHQNSTIDAAREGLQMDDEEINSEKIWTYEKFQSYIDENMNLPSDYVRKTLVPKMKKAMIHLIRATQMNLLRRSQLYQLFSVDFLLDKDLNLWFIETNSRPALTPTNEEMQDFFIDLITDTFEITNGLLRSRMKRAIVMTNEIMATNIENTEHELQPEKLRERFRKLIKNRFEPEFNPSDENGWEKIVDENLEGAAKYNGYIDVKCIF